MAEKSLRRCSSGIDLSNKKLYGGILRSKLNYRGLLNCSSNYIYQSLIEYFENVYNIPLIEFCFAIIFTQSL